LGQNCRWGKRYFVLHLRDFVTPQCSANFCDFVNMAEIQGFGGGKIFLNVRFYEIRVKTNKIVDQL
jgi:hypothetical protein